MKLRIGYLSTFYHTSILMIARDTLGSNAEWKLFGTGPAIVNAFEKGEIDLAYLGLPPAIIGIDREVRIKCIAGGHIEGTVICGTNAFTGWPETDDLDKILKQLAGYTIGVPGKGSIHDVILNECLRKHNLRGKVNVINFQWADQITEAVHKGEVHAAFGTPALATALQHFADCKVLYPPSKLFPNNPSYGILADISFMEREKSSVEEFIFLHEESAGFLRNSPDEAAKTISAYIGFITREFVLDTLRISPNYCAQITEGYIASTMEFVKILRELGYIKRTFSAAEIFDTSVISKIHGPGDHYSKKIKDKV